MNGGIHMVSALNGGGFGSSLFQQANQRLYSLGSQATRAKMEEVKEVTGSSNFGAGTTLGTGKFHQTQSSVVQNGTQSASCAAICGEYESGEPRLEQVPAVEPSGAVCWRTGDV